MGDPAMLRTASSWPLVGRELELRWIAEAIGRGPDLADAAMIRGEPGIGRTALLEHVAATSGTRTWFLRGAESEAALPFAAVAELLLPMAEFFDCLPPVQRHALESSLALRGGRPGSELAVCAAAWGVVVAATRAGPALLLVDDLQWVDSASRQVLLFLARRFTTAQGAVLFAHRDLPGDPDVTFGVATRTVQGLSFGDCRAMLGARSLQVPTRDLISIVDQTGGNPLAVLEAVAAVHTDPLRGRGWQSWDRGWPTSLHRRWASTILELPQPTQVGLCVLAASNSPAAGEVEAPLGDLDGSLADLAPAERRGLVQVRDEELTFGHPVLRSVILGCAPLATRIRVLRALAEHAEGLNRIRYLAASATGRDDRLAAALAEGALGASRHGDHRAAARVWRQAADMTGAADVQAERLLAAAIEAHLAGEAALAMGCCEDALVLRTDPAFVADAEVVRGRATSLSGHPQRALDELVRAGDTVLPHDAEQAARLYAEAVLPAALCCRFDSMARLAEHSAGIDGRNGTAQPHRAGMLALAAVLTGRTEHARRQLDRCEHPANDPHDPGDELAAVCDGQVRVWLEDFDAARQRLGAVLDRARRNERWWILATALGIRAELDWWSGHWTSAHGGAREALAWAERLGQAGAAGFALATIARVDAARGEPASCRMQTKRSLRDSTRHPVAINPVHICAASGLAALGSGELDLACDQLDLAHRRAQEYGLNAPNVVPFGGDLVEAHIRAGRIDRARTMLSWLDELTARGDLVYPAAAAARCRGLLADELDTAERCFSRAKALHRQRHVPFEYARTLLCEAEVIRRLRRPAAARPLLLEALSVFAALGAQPWTARTEAEMAATGGRATHRAAGGELDLDLLTPQELQVARSVATGRNNAETAAAMFVSRKTVEAHLTRIYRKLDIRSRTDLVRCFSVPTPTSRRGHGERHLR